MAEPSSQDRNLPASQRKPKNADAAFNAAHGDAMQALTPRAMARAAAAPAGARE